MSQEPESSLRIEAWSREAVELSPEQAQAISSSGLASIVLDEPPGCWGVVTDSRVGVAVGDGWELRVVPRISIPHLMFLLGYAADPRGWKDAVAAFAGEDDLFAAIASGFAHHAQRAVEPAPLRGYVTVEESAMTLRGRVRVADQIARSPGLSVPLEISYDDHTEDILENRLLRGAAELLLRLPGVPARARTRLLRVRAALENVLPARPGPSVVAPVPTRLNLRYRPALALAELILKGASVSTEKGALQSVAFVFDMNRVFEDFVSASLRTSLERFGGRVRLQFGDRHLDEERAIRLKPDITWWRGGACIGIVDAKYKPLDDRRFPNADAYQMLAYCTAFEVPRGFLVYARDAVGEPRIHRVAEGKVLIDVRALDLEVSPQEVIEQVETIAAVLATTRTTSDEVSPSTVQSAGA